jgi:hypothetical protein
MKILLTIQTKKRLWKIKKNVSKTRRIIHALLFPAILTAIKNIKF